MHELAPQHSVGSSGVAQMLQFPNMSQHIPLSLFASPPSTDHSHDTLIEATPLTRTHDTPPKVVTQLIYGSGHRGDPIDVCMGSFPRSSRVTNTGTIQCTFLVNEEGVPINTPKILRIF